MTTLDVPLTPDPAYAAFLAERAERLNSVHFSLSHPAMADARQRMEPPDIAPVLDGLRRLDGVPRFALMNARLHAPDAYFDTRRLDETASLLDSLLEAQTVDGVIFSDAYFLQALSDRHPELAGQLEAVPSVNAMLDSAERVHAMLDMIAATEFRPPSRLVLDRGLNRNITGLEATAKALRTTRPGLKLHLLANEGCLYQCPYKPAHDAHVALVNEGLCGERTFAMNRDLGCIRRLMNDPGSLLVSPFIRPEDTHRYTRWVDGFKLCGRNKGTEFLMRTVDAYLTGTFDGNLLDLMDAMGDLSDRLDLPNQALPDDFGVQVLRCDKQCRACGWCHALADRIVTRTNPGLDRLDISR